MSGTILSTSYTKGILKYSLLWHLHKTWINCMLYNSQIIYFTSFKCYGNKTDEINWISCGEIKTLPGMIRTDLTKEVTFKGGK